MKSGRAPSYKQIALAILNNDVSLKTLGFDSEVSEYYRALKKIEFDKNSNQIKLF